MTPQFGINFEQNAPAAVRRATTDVKEMRDKEKAVADGRRVRNGFCELWTKARRGGIRPLSYSLARRGTGRDARPRLDQVPMSDIWAREYGFSREPEPGQNYKLVTFV